MGPSEGCPEGVFVYYEDIRVYEGHFEGVQGWWGGHE